ncbi:glycosyltransferase [Lactobacillus sp. ESL0680]|uniref:glycosyltransferase n=1 Tax=Lactobacillus sp. ESL0680 TaxID=2983210 RepID=UPI0023F80EB8|nr:glycosyltransferase [Lactobacillus sp. ESL0680]WEV38556.1 glycosyltransferase [Lactobacillus sp. ESL0680]
MYYFLNNKIDLNSSGIEHAEIKRLKLFQEFNVNTKIVTFGYDRFAHRNIKSYGLTDDDYINMYDYFAGTIKFKSRVMTIDQLPLPNFAKKVRTGNGYEIYDESRKTMIINLLPNSRQLDTVEYLNGDGDCTKKDLYDYRGFLSVTQFYGTNSKLMEVEQFHKPDGTIYCETSCAKRPDFLAVTNIQLTDVDGTLYSLMNLGQAFTIMLDHLNKSDATSGEKSTFISDRSNITNLPMLNMKTKARKIEHFHNIHFRDYWDPMNSPLTYPSIANTDQLRKTSIVVVPTEKQAKDMRARLQTRVPIVAIPVGIVPKSQLQAPHISMKQRTNGKIIAVARLDYQKRLDDAINVFTKVYQKNSNLTFDIYGYGNDGDNGKEEKKLRELVKTLNMENAISFKGYVQDVNKVYDDAQLMILSSRYEGAPLCIVEAQSHGVPVISYDINYGPSDLIQDNKSGFLVPDGNTKLLEQKIEQFFGDKKLRENLSQGAYENAKRFSPEGVWQYWVKFVINQNKIIK